MISDEKKALLARLLLKQVSLATIVRIVGFPEIWLQRYQPKKIGKVFNSTLVIMALPKCAYKKGNAENIEQISDSLNWSKKL